MGTVVISCEATNCSSCITSPIRGKESIKCWDKVYPFLFTSRKGKEVGYNSDEDIEVRLEERAVKKQQTLVGSGGEYRHYPSRPVLFFQYPIVNHTSANYHDTTEELGNEISNFKSGGVSTEL